ncbi:hypothetical protein PVAND_017134 [Polypedilum vanderplanki]|uniref:Uncharacterized protein n=1 Tax=Polypedilum vanderplanki TaxID=319348 RepID=A0A9J6BHQ7_POLVA|nr:hypothetical protein PVAND_017134 [Polypedilum vanderplanki]
MKGKKLFLIFFVITIYGNVKGQEIVNNKVDAGDHYKSINHKNHSVIENHLANGTVIKYTKTYEDTSNNMLDDNLETTSLASATENDNEPKINSMAKSTASSEENELTTEKILQTSTAVLTKESFDESKVKLMANSLNFVPTTETFIEISTPTTEINDEVITETTTIVQTTEKNVELKTEKMAEISTFSSVTEKLTETSTFSSISKNEDEYEDVEINYTDS